MKRTIIAFLSLAAIFTPSVTKAQGNADPTGCVTYSLPSTVIALEVDAVQEKFYAGPYAKFAEKYLGAYIMSNNGKYFGKILWEDKSEKQSFVVELFRFESRSKILSNTFSTFVTKYTITFDELESDFKIVTPEIVKEELSNLFVQTGFTALKNNIAVGNDFKELFESDYREKGDDDGN